MCMCSTTFWRKLFPGIPDKLRGQINLLIFYVWIIVLILVGCRGRVADNEVVARVGNSTLNREEMKQRMAWEGMRPDQESDFVDRWVNRELLFQEGKRWDLDNSDELTWEIDLVEREYIIQKLLERTFAREVNISEEEIISYFEEHKEEFRIDEEEVRALHILTETRAVANLARQEIVAGKSFEEVAKEYSIGIFKDRGGDMGFFRKQDVIPEIERYAFRLSEGRMSSVFSSSHGYHVLKVLKKLTRGDYKELQSVREEIFNQIRVNKERSVYYNLLSQLQNKTKVSVSIPTNRDARPDTLAAEILQEIAKEQSEQ